MKPGDDIQYSYVPGATQAPSSVGQERVDGRFLQGSSLFDKSFAKTVNIDKKRIAGQNINAGQAVGTWGYIVNTDHALENATQATFVDEANATTNYDATNPLQIIDAGTDKWGLMSWSSLPNVTSIISGISGATLLSIEVRFKMNITDNAGSGQVRWSYNGGTFVEGTVTWNTKPASTEGASPTIFDNSDADGYFTSGWLTVSSTEYAGIRSNGITLKAPTGGNFSISDEDQTNKPQIQVRYTYEVQDTSALRQVFLASGLATKYANGFIGFAQNTVVKGGTVKVRIQGIDSNQSNLTANTNYLLSDTPGSINTSGGTSDKTIGVSSSATEIQINYNLADAT